MPFVLDDLLLMAALGAGTGALTNKKNPLKGALLGGALGGIGGAVAPGLLGAGGATAGVAPGATAATESAGLLGAEGLNAAGYMAPEMGGMVAEQAAAPVVDIGTQAGMFDTMNYQSGGLLGKAKGAFDTANKIAKPVGMAMHMGQQMAGQEQPMMAPPPPQMPSGRQDLAGLLQYGQQQQQYDAQEAERRKQLMQAYAGNIGRMGGY